MWLESMPPHFYSLLSLHHHHNHHRLSSYLFTLDSLEWRREREGYEMRMKFGQQINTCEEKKLRMWKTIFFLRFSLSLSFIFLFSASFALFYMLMKDSLGFRLIFCLSFYVRLCLIPVCSLLSAVKLLLQCFFFLPSLDSSIFALFFSLSLPFLNKLMWLCSVQLFFLLYADSLLFHRIPRSSSQSQGISWCFSLIFPNSTLTVESGDVCLCQARTKKPGWRVQHTQQVSDMQETREEEKEEEEKRRWVREGELNAHSMGGCAKLFFFSILLRKAAQEIDITHSFQRVASFSFVNCCCCCWCWRLVACSLLNQ